MRSLNLRNSFGDCLFRLISPPMKFPPQAVIGGSSPSEKAIKRAVPIDVWRQPLFYSLFIQPWEP